MPDSGLAEMAFLDHLEELRWSLIWGFAGVLGATIICSFFSGWIIDVLLLGPTRADFFMYRVYGMDSLDLVLQNRTITGQFFAHVGTIVAVGVVVGSPVFVYSLWRFVEPGLYPDEKSGMRFAAVFATLCFVLGIVFAYLVIAPLALQFFAAYVISDQIINEFDVTKYFSMLTFWCFGVGVLFELPVIVYFLSKAGLANPERLREWRKYAVVVVLVMGAFFTPPDPVSQILVALPLLMLYEGSIYISAWVVRKQRRRAAKRGLA